MHIYRRLNVELTSTFNLPDCILSYMLKQRLKAVFFGSKAYQVIVSTAFGIDDRDVDPVRENLPTVYEVTGGKNRIV